MRVAVASGFACSTSWWLRLQDEGCDVLVWIDRDSPPTDKITHVGDGLVDKARSFEELLEWAQEGMRSGEPTLVFFDASGMGEKADDARKKGLHVIGGGSFMDKLENDRKFGQDIAAAAGCQIPPFKAFSSLSSVQEFARTLGPMPVYFKTDSYLSADDTRQCKGGAALYRYMDELKAEYRDKIKCIVQKKMEGVALSTARWWNGKVWVGPYEWTIEHKALMNDDVGPSTGCSFNSVGFYERPRIAEQLGWDKLTPEFVKNEAPPGLYDINAVVTDDAAYFLEWTPRLGYDSEMTSARLIPDLSKHLWTVATGDGEIEVSSEIGYAVRLWIPPYPWEFVEWTDKHSCLGARIHNYGPSLWAENFIAYQVRMVDENLEIASPEGLLGLSLSVGNDLSDLHDETIEFAGQLDVRGLGYRTDGGTVCKKDAEELKKRGHDLHPGLLR
jgi:phosphoribosylamine---glycine ligase